MAYDEGLAELMRGDLAELPGLTEKKMFGGLCFLQHGNMICGVHAGGAMFRVGKELEPEARRLPGARDMDFTGRKMGGMLFVSDEVLSDDHRRGQLMALARENLHSLPPR